MSHFTSDFNPFFVELASHNNKEWFDLNRERYHTNIKKPFENFISDIAAEISKIDPNFIVESRKAIFRINRDIRFSKDKTPYKLNRSAFLSPHGRKDNRPGLYVSLGPESVRIGGGVFSPNRSELMKIRLAIVSNPNGFYEAIENKQFKKIYGKLQGAENKRLPTIELMNARLEHPLLLKKQFYYMVELPPETVNDSKLVQKVVSYYMAGAHVKHFFEKALLNPSPNDK